MGGEIQLGRKEMKKIFMVSVVVASLMFLGCGKKGGDSSGGEGSGGAKYPEGVRTAYLESCVGGAASMGDKAKPYCTCTFNKIEKKYSLQEFVDLASKMQGGDLPDEFMTIVKSCL